MSDQLTTERLREIANPVYVPCVGQDEAIAMATELLAKREECEGVGRHRDQLLDLAHLDNEAAREAVLSGRENKFRFGAMTTRDAIAEVVQQRDAARALLELVAGNLANFVAKREDAPASADAHMNEAMESLVAYQPKDFYSEAAKALRLNLWREGPMRTLQDERDAARAEAEKLRRELLNTGLRAGCLEAERDAARAEAEKLRRELLNTGLRAGCLEAERDAARAEAEKLRAELAAVKRQRDELLASSEPVADALRDIAGDGHRAYLDAYESAVASIIAASQPAQQPKPEGGAS